MPGIRQLAIALGFIAPACGSGPPCDAVMTHAVHLVSSDAATAGVIATCADFPRAQRACIAKARSDAEVLDCAIVDAGDHPSRDGVLISEGELGIEELARRVQLHGAMHGHLPSSSAALTPATSCCEMDRRMCAYSPGDWTGTWRDLGFRPRDRFRFRYAYHAAARDHAVLRAVADLDCDDTDTTSYELAIDTGADGQIRIGDLVKHGEGPQPQ